MKDGVLINMTQGFKHIHETIKSRVRRGQLTIKEGMSKEKELLSAIDFWRRMIFKARNDFEGAGIAMAIHALYENCRERADAQDPVGTAMVTCRAGCNACCRILVSVTPHEANLLARHVVNNELEIDRDRLARQAAGAANPAAFRDLTPEDRMCVFNGPDGNCRVYQDRPLACRNYRVTSDPKNCETSRISPVTVKVEPNTEALVTAAFTDCQSGALPELLAGEIARLEAAAGSPQATTHSSPSSTAPEGRPEGLDDPSSKPAQDTP